jgi:hypothetical protein
VRLGAGGRTAPVHGEDLVSICQVAGGEGVLTGCRCQLRDQGFIVASHAHAGKSAFYIRLCDRHGGDFG